jgi:CBS domain-containing protein
VVAEGGTLLGRIRRSALSGDSQARAEEVMEAGPSTVRPDAALRPLIERLRERELRSAVVTTPEGRLLGVLLRKDAEAAVERVHRSPTVPPHR